MELKDLIGNHKLSGFEYGGEEYTDILGETDDREFIIFILDGVKYLASENPEDGYRSIMNELEITNREVSNIFKPIDVICKMKESDDDFFETNDILEIYDKQNNKLILAIGTGHIDDYYPYFECKYIPENMSINEN